MPQTTTISPLASLASAEQQLIGTVNAAADRLDNIATTAVDAALARMEESARMASERIASAFARVNTLAADVLASLQQTAQTISQQTAGHSAPPVEQPAAVEVVAPVVEAPSKPAPAIESARPVEVETVARAANAPVDNPAPVEAPTASATTTKDSKPARKPRAPRKTKQSEPRVMTCAKCGWTSNIDAEVGNPTCRKCGADLT
jgi:hypothetical protein